MSLYLTELNVVSIYNVNNGRINIIIGEDYLHIYYNILKDYILCKNYSSKNYLRLITGTANQYMCVRLNIPPFNDKIVIIHTYKTHDELCNSIPNRYGSGLTPDDDEYKSILTADEFDNFMLEYARKQMTNIKQIICDDTNKQLSKIQEDIEKLKIQERLEGLDERIEDLEDLCFITLDGIEFCLDMNCPSELCTKLNNRFVELVIQYSDQDLFSEEEILRISNLKILYDSKKVEILGDYIKLYNLIRYPTVFRETSAYYRFCEKLEEELKRLPNKDNVENIKIKHTTLNQDNLLLEAITFHKKNNLSSVDFIETIQEMLDTKQYELSETFMSSKIDFQEANVYFMSSIAPKKVGKEDLQKLLFKNIVCDNLI